MTVKKKERSRLISFSIKWVLGYFVLAALTIYMALGPSASMDRTAMFFHLDQLWINNCFSDVDNEIVMIDDDQFSTQDREHFHKVVISTVLTASEEDICDKIRASFERSIELLCTKLDYKFSMKRFSDSEGLIFKYQKGSRSGTVLVNWRSARYKVANEGVWHQKHEVYICVEER